jgi:hypothetical protein
VYVVLFIKQLADFEGAVSGCLSYHHGTTLSVFECSTAAGA